MLAAVIAVGVASCGPEPDIPLASVTPVPTLTTAQREAIPCGLMVLHYEAMEEEGWTEDWRALGLMGRLDMTVGEMVLQLQTCNKMIEDGEYHWRTTPMRVAVASYPVCLDESEEIHSFWHGVAKDFFYEDLDPERRLSTAPRNPNDFHQVIVTIVLPPPEPGTVRFGGGPSIYYAIRPDPIRGCVHDLSETLWVMS